LDDIGAVKVGYRPLMCLCSSLACSGDSGEAFLGGSIETAWNDLTTGWFSYEVSCLEGIMTAALAFGGFGGTLFWYCHLFGTPYIRKFVGVTLTRA